MSFDFSAKCAVVTGGSNGIGLAAARALAAGGAKVWILDPEQPSEVNAEYLPVNITDPATISAALAKIGAPDVVIANAGVGSEADFTSTTRENWDGILAINLSGVFQPLRTPPALRK